jgi:FtsP/CotA-like multicopper oxidase with cupredoxin domain
MSMMHHPKHLHGHFFRVLNTQGEYSPLKHTADVAPMTTTVIRFAADEFGDWYFHCKNRTPKKAPTTNKKR